MKRHSLGYRVPRDRQLDSLVIHPDGVTIVTDTVYPMECVYCDTTITGPTKTQSDELFREHMEEEHSGMSVTNQYDEPDWFREQRDQREADIAKLMYDTKDHDN